MKIFMYVLFFGIIVSQDAKITKVSESIYMIQKSGGNIGVLIGSDGVFMIDDQFANVTNEIQNAIKTISNEPIKYIVNTHFHGDHTGGNVNFGKTGATIVAHENVRKRLSSEQLVEFFNMKMKATENIGKPKITFRNDIQFYLNDEEIDIFHVSNAHTDGDAIIYFKSSNVVHLGDLYFAEMYPFFDVANGGNIKGIINGLKKIHSQIDENTKIIPGHGQLSNKKELSDYITMLETLVKTIETHIKNGDSLSDIQSKNVTKDFDEQFGKSFIKPKDIVFLMHGSLTK